MSPPAVPRFRTWPVLVTGLFLYLLMSVFFGLFFVGVDEFKASLAVIPPEPNREAFGWLSAELGLLVAAGLVVWLYHGPLRRTFAALRAGLSPRPVDWTRARTRVFRSPVLLGLGLPLVLGLSELLLMGAWMMSPGHRVSDLPPELREVPLTLVFLVLAALFCSTWLRHRVQTLWIRHLFSPQELAERLPPTRNRGLLWTLGFLALLASALPVAVVLVLLFSGLSDASGTPRLSDDQWTLLLGTPTLDSDARALINEFRLEQVPLLYVNSIDTWRLVLGSTVGVVFSLGYVFLIFRWIGGDLTTPLLSLRRALGRLEAQGTTDPEPVLTDNEVGQLTLGFNRMLQGLGERDRIKGLFGQYLTSEVSQAILDGRVKLGGDRYDVTVMFTDIRDFTALSESLPPEEVFTFLNEYLDAMIEVLVAKGGFIDKFLGDGILTVFGLPVPREDHAAAALEAAEALEVTLAQLNRRRADLGQVPIAIGSGLNSGPVIAGNVGSQRKLQYTVIGDTVNLASRLEGMNKRWGTTLTLSQATWDRLPEEVRQARDFVCEPGVEIRGKKDPVTLYRLA